MHQIMLALSADPAIRVWRNNVGSARTETGFVRFGLAVGSSDLIGIQRLPSGVGRFFSIEVKTARGSPTERQLAWIVMVRAFGGAAGIARSVEDAWAILA